MSSVELALSASALDTLFREARTANTFTDEPVSEEMVQAIYDLVKWGPTAMNSQPLRILAVRSREAREQLVEHMNGNNKQKTLTAPMVFVLAADTRFHENFPRTFPPFPGAKDSLDPEEKTAERVELARFNGALQAGYVLLAIRAAGLAAGPMLGFNKAAVDRTFFPDGRWQSLLVVNVGKPGPNAWRERLTRLDYAEAVKTI